MCPVEDSGARGSSSMLLRTIICVLLFSCAGCLEAVRLRSLTDLDVWTHLRTGTWIVQHHALPHTALFSQYPNLPWSVPTWGFDLKLGILYAMLGLRAIPALLMLTKVLIAVALFLVAGGRRRFWLATVITGCALFALSGLPPRPISVGVLLFAIEVGVLFGAQSAGAARALYALPLLFLIWTNFDWHFVLGIVVLLAFVLIATARHLLVPEDKTSVVVGAVPVPTLWAITATSVIGTVLSPYTWQGYFVAWTRTFDIAALRHFPELRSMSFREPSHYMVLCLTLMAFLMLGRRRSRDVFQYVVLILCAMLAFRFYSEMWFVVVASVAVIGDVFPEMDAQSSWRPTAIGALAALLLALGAILLGLPRDNSVLLAKTAQALPVRACDYIRQNDLPTPLWNSIQWGSFVTWALPNRPPSIDQRLELYGDEITERYFSVARAQFAPESDPQFASSRTFLLDANSAVAEALSKSPNCEIVYRDDLAVVLVKKE